MIELEICRKADYGAVADEIARLGRLFYEKGWNLATSSNYSVLLEREPMRVLMTTSGRHKGELSRADFLIIDENLEPVRRLVDDAACVESVPGKPSAEAGLHLEMLKRGAGAVLHSHSVWSTVLSNHYFSRGYIELSGYEMLKALEGVRSHDVSIRLPVFQNTQDMKALAQAIGNRLDNGELAHGFLLRGHGLYVWGPTLSDARNRLEALEFLMEVLGRGGELAATALSQSI